ncbi:TetR/AcrR family transcriptional regulator [Bacillus sp. DNRA2]|uniref:TetR/AcrR family transcriptional regulator n=1 Tax=Bacillus sp. DNRA2 TaxID=2723053 RepID=UPI00145FB541|nr:TetR/AcrR family transcriptional regulator [Bacillus sp. DNRA2]NMD71214.1 TetR/AcrR family transcriptional regulator [Bacillus sp. DNRA2]
MKKKTREQQAEETRQRIYQTALRLFETKGFNQVSVDEIVRKSKSSKGAFYGHFASKYDIFIEKFKEIDLFYENFVQNLPSHLPFEEKVIALFDAQMTFLQNELGEDLMRSVYTSGLIKNEANFFANTDRSLYKILKQFVNEAIDHGELPNSIEIDKTSLFISRCMRGTLYDWLSFGDTFNLNDEAKTFIAIFLKGLMK